jgi:hypothetical protein
LLPLIAMASLALPGRVYADSSTVTHFSFQTELVVTACLGTTLNPYAILVSGKGTLVAHLANGAVTFFIRDEHFTGEGVSDGAQYVGGQTTMSAHRLDRDGVMHVTFVATTRLISPGVGRNLIVHVLLRFSVDGGFVIHQDQRRVICVPSR